MVKEAKKEGMKIIPAGRKKCVWMESGVVSYKLCDNNYDCPTCAYDHAMQAKASRAQDAAPASIGIAQDKVTERWVERMLMLPAHRRKCRYMLTGEVARKICPNAYECGSCSFDQTMRERLHNEEGAAVISKEIEGFKLAEGFFYHEGHTWARQEYGGGVRVGMDDFIQKLLGTLSGVDLPDVGQEMKQGARGLTVRKNGHVASLLSPIEGVVLKVNHEVASEPGRINASPYEAGWLFVVEPTRAKKDFKALLSGAEAEDYLTREREALLNFEGEEYRLAADGGLPLGDISKGLSADQWKALTKRFLRN